MKKKWFKRKLYGYGWYPISWQGWVCVLVFVGLNVYNFMRIDAESHSASDTLINFFPPFILTLVILIWICVKKGEPARWQWGERIEDEENLD